MFGKIAERLETALMREWNTRAYGSHFSNIILLVVVAHGWEWFEDDRSAPRFFSNGVLTVISRGKTLWWHRGDWLRQHFLQGLVNLGGVRLERFEFPR
jgi:hypothetical protein